MEKAAKVLEKMCNRISHKIKNNDVTNTFKEHKYFQQNPHLSEFDLDLQYNGFIWDKNKTHTKCMFTGFMQQNIYATLTHKKSALMSLTEVDF